MSYLDIANSGLTYTLVSVALLYAWFFMSRRAKGLWSWEYRRKC